MAEETILTWNVTNWLTVVLMVLVGFGVLAVAAQLFHSSRGTPKASG